VGFAWTRDAFCETGHRALISSKAYTDIVKNSNKGIPVWGRVIGGAVAAGAGTALYYSNLEKTPASCGGPGVTAGAHRPELPTFSKDEVAKHRTKDTGIWVTYKDGVYDVTEWVDIHPGGASRLMLAAGGPIDPFWAMYAQHNTDQVQSILEEYRLGNLEGGGSVPVGNPYENEPNDRHPSLVVRSTTPMNSETPMELLGESLVTSNDLFFIRNHLPVPDIDGKEYSIEVDGEGLKRLSLSLDDLKSNFKKHSITATIQCTGNRRKDMMDGTCI
jgi:sulfite oxidase